MTTSISRLLTGAMLSLTLAAADAQSVLARLDKSSADFKGMTAKINRVTHTAVINDSTTETGAISLLRVKPGDARMLIQFEKPDPKSISFENRKATIFYPKQNAVEIYDLGKHGRLIDQFLLLGFGTSGKELAKSYDVTLLGQETVEGQKTTKIGLVPRDKQVKEHLQKVELWLADNGDYPVQQKFFQPSGDWIFITYTGVGLNPPLTADAVRLKLPANVEKRHPQK